jgi:DnaJ-like protein
MTAAEALLGIALPASAEEVKRAYRRQISRYHPDKVQHLGEEFQVMAAEKSAQLTHIYQQLLESSGSGEIVEAARTAAEASTPAAGTTQTASVGAAPRQVNRASTWQAVAVGCPSLILGAAVDRVTQSVRWTLPRAEDVPVAGFTLACRTRPDWRGFFKRRRPTEAVLLRAPADTGPGPRQRIRDLLPGVDGAIVMIDLVLNPLAAGQQEPIGRTPPARREADVFSVTVDAMTWKARVPPHAPEIAHLILERLRDARV